MLYLMIVILVRKTTLLILKIDKFLVLCTNGQSHISNCVNGKQLLLLFHLLISGRGGRGKSHLVKIIFHSVNKVLMCQG